jgi:hypothetical protein
MGHDDRAHGGGGRRGIGRAPALTKRGKTSRRGEVMSARDETIRGTDGWASGHLYSMVLKVRMRSRPAKRQLRPLR